MFIKFANADLLEARIARPGEGMLKSAHKAVFDYTPREGFLYVRSRAISNRTNDNYDTWPDEELRQAWGTFIGKPVFVNHHNDEVKRKRGVIIDAALHEDIGPDGRPDVWIEVLMEIDAIRFPKLAQAILNGDIERTSMGADVGESECAYCGNVATTPNTYCAHIKSHKGRRLARRNLDGSEEDVLVHEICIAQGEMVSTLRGLVPIEGVVVGDMALTRAGWRRVTDARQTGVRPTVKITLSDGTTLRCTEDHLIATAAGWTPAVSLLVGDVHAEAAMSVGSLAGIHVGVLYGELVTSLAVGLEGVAVVESVGDGVNRSEMARVDAVALSADVVDFDPLEIMPEKVHHSSVNQSFVVRVATDAPVPIGGSRALPDHALVLDNSPGEQSFQFVQAVCVSHDATVPVYDLTVDGEHEFVANGIVVHNCRKISFFENSVLVEPPADPTALTLGVDARGLASLPEFAHMRPSDPISDQPNDGWGDPESSGDLNEGDLASPSFASRRASSQAADLDHVGLGELRGSVPRSASTASTPGHVGRVLGEGAQQPMGRVVAQRSVAGVPNDQAIRDRTNERLVAPSVRSDGAASGIVQRQASVPVGEGPSRPRPARVGTTRGVDLRQVPLHDRLGSLESAADHVGYITAGTRGDARGFACAIPEIGREALAMVRRMSKGTATVDDIIRCATDNGRHGVGVMWGLESSKDYGPEWADQGAEDYAFVNDDTIVKAWVESYFDNGWNATDDEIWEELNDNLGEIQVILVGKAESGYVTDNWDASIAQGSKIHLSEVRYNAGWGWKTLKANGKTVTAIRKGSSFEEEVQEEMTKMATKNKRTWRKTAGALDYGPMAPGRDAGTRWEGIASLPNSRAYKVVVLWSGDEAPLLSGVFDSEERAQEWAQMCVEAGGINVTIENAGTFTRVSKTAAAPSVEVTESKDYNTGFISVVATIKISGPDRTVDQPSDFWVVAKEWTTKKWTVRVVHGPWNEQVNGSYYHGESLPDFEGTKSEAKALVTREVKKAYAAWVAGGQPRTALGSKTAAKPDTMTWDEYGQHGEEKPELITWDEWEMMGSTNYGLGYSAGSSKIVSLSEALDWAGPTDVESFTRGYEDGRAGRPKTGSTKLSWGETKAPPQVNTLGITECPVCGTTNQFDSTGRCMTCGHLPAPDPFREPDLEVAQKVDMRDGWVNPSLLSAPAFVPPAEGEAGGGENDPKPDDPVQKASSATEVVEGPEGDTMRPSQAIIASQEQRIARLSAENAVLRRRAGLTVTADEENPAQPVPEPAPGASTQSTDETRSPDTTTDVTTPGAALTDVAPMTTTDVTTPGAAATEVGADATTEVTTPVAGTTEMVPYEQSVTLVQPDASGASNGTDKTNAFAEDNSWVQSAEARIKARTYACLRLAKLRVQAGLDSGDELVIAQRIEASKPSDDAIRTEIATLQAVAQRQASVTPRRHEAVRTMPSLASTGSPMGRTAATHGDDDSILW